MNQDQPTVNSSPSTTRTLLFRMLVAGVVIVGGLFAIIWYANH